MATRIAIVGLGRFGMSVVNSLAATNVQVIGIDTNPELVDEAKNLVDVAVVLDSTDERALRSQDVHQVDAIVIAIGENFEAALLTAVLAKRLGIARLICRATSAMHAEIFRQIGATEVIQPEAEIGLQLARRLANPFLEDFIDLGEGFTLIEMHAPAAFRGKSLRELNLRANYGVNLVGIRRAVAANAGDGTQPSRHMLGVPQPDEVIQDDDLLIVIGSNKDLARLPKE